MTAALRLDAPPVLTGPHLEAVFSVLSPAGVELHRGLRVRTQAAPGRPAHLALHAAIVHQANSVAAQPSTAALAPATADLFRRVWSAGTRRAGPSAAELQIALAISWGETGLASWKPFPGRYNYGSVQCPKSGSDCSPQAQRGKTCFLWSDTLDGREETRFAQCFEQYPTAEAGATEFLRQISAPMRPRTAAAMAGGAYKDTVYAGGCVRDVCHAMKVERYYGLAEDSYVRAVWGHVHDVAAALGVPVAATLEQGAAPAMGSSAGPLLLAGGALAAWWFLGR